MRRRSPQASWPPILLVGALLFTGCSADTEPATGDPGTSDVASEEVPSGDTTIDTPGGGQVVTSGELSEGYPSEQVPVVPGKVLSSASSPDAGFAVTVLVVGDPKRVAEDATALLTEQGFKVRSRTTTPGAVGLLLTTKRYRVELASTLSGGQTTLTYFVAAR